MGFPKVGFGKGSAVNWSRPKPMMPAEQQTMKPLPKVSDKPKSLGRMPQRKEDPLTALKRFRKQPPKSWTGGDQRMQGHAYVNPSVDSSEYDEPLPNPEYQGYAYPPQAYPPQPRMKPVIGPRYDPMAFRGDEEEFEERAPSTFLGESFERLMSEDYEQRTVDDYDGVVGEYPDDYVGKPYYPPRLKEEAPAEKKEQFWEKWGIYKKIQSELAEEDEIRVIAFFPAVVFLKPPKLDIDEV